MFYIFGLHNSPCFTDIAHVIYCMLRALITDSRHYGHYTTCPSLSAMTTEDSLLAVVDKTRNFLLEKDVAWVKIWVIALGFANWTVFALEEIFISTCGSSRVIRLRFNSRTSTTDVSLKLRQLWLCPSEGHKHGVSIQLSNRPQEEFPRGLSGYKP